MSDYIANALTADDIAQAHPRLVLDFGTNWCGYCGRARTIVDPQMLAHPDIPHLRVEDGPGRRLGRHYKVKLWPTLIFLHEGIEVARIVRPHSAEEIADALALLASAT